MSTTLTTILTFLIRIIPFLLDLLIVLSSIILTGMLYYQQVPASNKDFIMLALGILLGKLSTVIDFHRGTSSQRAPKREGDYRDN